MIVACGPPASPTRLSDLTLDVTSYRLAVAMASHTTLVLLVDVGSAHPSHTISTIVRAKNRSALVFTRHPTAAVRIYWSIGLEPQVGVATRNDPCSAED
jgi:hypothetical protein